MYSDAEFSELDLYKGIAEGDEKAFSIFYNRHWRKLYRFLFTMTKSHEVAEELMEDVFLKLWIGREMIPEIRNMDGFLFKVAYHKALDFLKLTARQADLKKVINRQMAEQSAECADQNLLYSEYQDIVNSAIQKLSPQRKLVFTLSREEGMTHEQIARQLNLSPQTVKRTMSDALEAIRKFLRDHSSAWTSFLLIFFF